MVPGAVEDGLEDHCMELGRHLDLVCGGEEVVVEVLRASQVGQRVTEACSRELDVNQC